MSNKFDCVVYMIPLEDGLNQKQWEKIHGFFYCEDELIPIEISANNTTMIGLARNLDEDIREEYVSELTPIAEDWNKEPESGELETESGYRIKILCDFHTFNLSDQYELGKLLYYDWASTNIYNTYETIRKLGNENVNIEELKRGFIDERLTQVSDDGQSEECFYGAMDEIGVQYWNEEKPKEIEMVQEKSWQEFRDSGLFWWINMILHTFGWAIVVDVNDKGEIERAYPARVRFRGFSEQANSKGYQKVSKHLKENIDQLVVESKE